MVRTEEGDAKALYMVCTHLGCLYKWEPANWRFECPCHGSKFTHDGFYIEGPAPRSLDSFEIEPAEDGQLAINTGRKITGPPAAESPARAVQA
jgi:cytochrome b6-f complex iron-sulfur subunit